MSNDRAPLFVRLSAPLLSELDARIEIDGRTKQAVVEDLLSAQLQAPTNADTDDIVDLAGIADVLRVGEREILDRIAAGDIFQANITRRLSAPFSGSPRRFAVQALRRSSARYGAYLEQTGGRCLLSLSPELFLQFEPAGRRVVTRPIKGTRSSAVDASELMG